MPKVPANVPKQIDYTDITPSCEACGERYIGLGTPVMMCVPGMLFPSVEHAVPVFIPDPDVSIGFLQMPNGMIGYLTDTTQTKYVHQSCFDDLIEQAAFENTEDDDEDEPEEE